jgi:hypothetical protein
MGVRIAPPQRADADAAWAALLKAQGIGAQSQREHDRIEALSAYFRDYDKVPVDVRLAAYNSAMEQLTQRYPDGLKKSSFSQPQGPEFLSRSALHRDNKARARPRDAKPAMLQRRHWSAPSHLRSRNCDSTSIITLA